MCLLMLCSFCVMSCQIHKKGDITDLAVSSNNAIVASSSNDCIIRVVSHSNHLINKLF